MGKPAQYAGFGIKRRRCANPDARMQVLQFKCLIAVLAACQRWRMSNRS